MDKVHPGLSLYKALDDKRSAGQVVKKSQISNLPAGLHPHQFAYRANRFTADIISTALHSALSHLEQQGSYVWLLFVDFGSAFNTIIPSRLVTKLLDLGLSYSTCLWIKESVWQLPEGEGWPLHLFGPQLQHWLLLGLCAQPSTFHPLHP